MIMQGSHRVRSRGTQGWGKAGQYRDSDQHESDQGEGDWVEWFDPVKHVGQQSAEGCRCGEACDDAYSSELQPAAEDHAQHIRTLRANSHAQRDLEAALGNCVSEQAI